MDILLMLFQLWAFDDGKKKPWKNRYFVPKAETKQQPPKTEEKRVAAAVYPTMQVTKNSVYIIGDASLVDYESPEKGARVKDFAMKMETDKSGKKENLVFGAANGGFFDILKNGRIVPTAGLGYDYKEMYKPVVEVAQGYDLLRGGYIKENAKSHLNSYFTVFIRDDKPEIISSTEFYDKYHENPSEFDKNTKRFSHISMYVECYPRLLENGELCKNGYLSSDAKAKRTAVGIMGDGKFVIYCSKDAITFGELANRLKEIGCVSALNMDGGGSTQIYSPTTPEGEVLPDAELLKFSNKKQNEADRQNPAYRESIVVDRKVPIIFFKNPRLLLKTD